MDYAPRGIQINAVCPGVVDTPMGGGMGPDVIKEIMRDQPIARLGRSDGDCGVGPLALQSWRQLRARRGPAG
jgi:NAD(P)-dependent dehydrogenase (short-subunit alcohol dehydrogenase family)